MDAAGRRLNITPARILCLAKHYGIKTGQRGGQRFVRYPSGAILQGPADGCLVDVGEFGLLMADVKEESLVNAICDEMQRRGVRETYIVSADFVRDAIREKLERERHEETADKA